MSSKDTTVDEKNSKENCCYRKNFWRILSLSKIFTENVYCLYIKKKKLWLSKNFLQKIAVIE